MAMASAGRSVALLLLVVLFTNQVVEGGDAPEDPAAVEQQLAAKDTRIAELERDLRILDSEGGRSRGGASLRADTTLEDRVKVLEGRLSSVDVSAMDAQVAPP
jgi:vacuolar-type H+-ATPase subunit I/STV1